MALPCAAVAVEVCRSLAPALLPQAVMVLAHLAATQPQLSTLPDEAFRHLGQQLGLVEALAGLVEHELPAAPLVALVAQATASQLDASADYDSLALGLATQLPLGTVGDASALCVCACCACFVGNGAVLAVLWLKSVVVCCRQRSRWPAARSASRCCLHRCAPRLGGHRPPGPGHACSGGTLP